MFTGLVKDIGTVESLHGDGEGVSLRIATALGPQIAPGDSVAVNGVCLTATAADAAGFAADAVKQTLLVTSLGALAGGDLVNLEPALRAGDRLGGHFVAGHVDGTAEVESVTQEGASRRLRVRLGAELLRYAVPRGSITLEGVSLTVAALGDGWLEVALVPETLQRTTLGDAVAGRRLNVESDVVAKYVERLVSPFTDSEDG